MKSVMLLKNRGWSLHLKRVGSFLHLTKTYYPEPWFSRFVEDLRTANAVRILRRLAELPVTEYGHGMEYAVRAQLVAFFKKYDFSSMPDVAEHFRPLDSAIEKFMASEWRCKRVNSRLLALRIRASTVGFDDTDTSRRLFHYYGLMETARRYISRVLGPLDLSSIYSECDFGPGASIGNPRSRGTNLGRKLLAKTWTCSRSALSYAIPAMFQNLHIRELMLSDISGRYSHDYDSFRRAVMEQVVFVEHNNIAFVPKSYKIKRPVAVEPLLNGFIQKGIDTIMRRRLLRFGIDLTNQESNSLLARAGSVSGDYSTIDLSSASDTISRELVRQLVPHDWFELMDNVRSRSYSYGSVVTRYHKFCSMGNGFCFPLQSLIFRALAYAVARYTGSRHRCLVYGDDIIVCKNDSLLLIELLRFLGFKTNTEKTFIVGPFRESCGTDWYEGTDVRPVYFTSVGTNIDAYISHNQSLEWFLSPLFDDDRALLREIVPRRLRFMRPFKGNSDSAFTVPRDVFMTCPYARWLPHLWNWEWRELSYKTAPDHLNDMDWVASRAKEFVKYLAYLKGASSSCTLALGGSKPRARVVRKSYWGQRTY